MEGRKWNNFRVKAKRAIMFLNVKLYCFYFLFFEVCKYVSSKYTIEIGISANIGHRSVLFFIIFGC